MRITGGRWRSRALDTPRGMTTRPTSDRVREALFSMLVADGLLGTGPSDETGPRVLDLYAGSGALAFEALSRGASAAVLVEQGREALAAIRENAHALEAESLVRVVAGKVDRTLGKLEGQFGIVFADPPYAEVRSAAFAGILQMAAALLLPEGALVLEHASSDAPPAVPGLMLDRSRRHGDTTISLYVRSSDPASDPPAP